MTIPRILIIDDNEKNLFAMKTILQTVDAQLDLALSGNEGLSLTLRHDYCLILLDVQMPEMDGFEFASLIRGNKHTAHIPIIFVTALSKEDKHVDRGYEIGAVDYLFKPVSPAILKSKVKVFLELTHKKRLETAVEQLEQTNMQLNHAVMMMSSIIAHCLKPA